MRAASSLATAFGGFARCTRSALLGLAPLPRPPLCMTALPRHTGVGMLLPLLQRTLVGNCSTGLLVPGGIEAEPTAAGPTAEEPTSESAAEGPTQQQM